MSRICDAYKCGAAVPAGRFLCTRHWRMVPLSNRITINRRYRACREDFGFLQDPQYLAACVAAITWIASAEGHQIGEDVGEVSAYGRLLKVALRKKETRP